MLDFVPKFFTTIKDYNKNQFFKDITSGFIVAIVALPLSIAFGIASGASPQAGLITAVIAGFLISFFGGSKVQIGGPTGAFIVIVYGVIQQFGISGLIISTIMAGLILITMGFLKIGSWIRFISVPLVTGFTSGIAIIIFSSQIKDFFGLTIDGEVPAEFIEKWQVYFHNFNYFSWHTIFISLFSISILVLCTKFKSKIPGPFLALITSSLAVYLFNIPVETIGDRFGQINFTLNSFVIPQVSFNTIIMLIPPAITIALLGAIESLLSAVVSDGMIRDKHKPNTELIAQGIANVVTAFFGGLPATGAIVRTATNVKNGGRTPVAGMSHSVFLFIMLLFFSNLVCYIPMATLASVLIVVSYNMSQWREFLYLIRSSPRNDVIILIITFVLTILVDLTFAIGTGLVLSSFFFMDKMYKVSEMDKFDLKTLTKKDKSTKEVILPENVIVLDPSGAFFFGASAKFSEVLDTLNSYDYIIFRMNRIHMIDATGIKVLKNFIEEFKERNVKIIFTEVSREFEKAFRKGRIYSVIDEKFIVPSFDDALKIIKKDYVL